VVSGVKALGNKGGIRPSSSDKIVAVLHGCAAGPMLPIRPRLRSISGAWYQVAAAGALWLVSERKIAFEKS
jgi:hypothetical protein